MACNRSGKVIKQVLVICGPTASGKSALAIDIAEEFGGVVINADSMQIYDTLSILTSRPDEQAEQRVDHRLYGVMPSSVSCSVGHWRNLANEEIVNVHASGRLPIVTGGTGMYLRALIQGLAVIPPVPDQIREEIRNFYDDEGSARALEELKKVDPEAAGRLHQSDQQRIVRALEVYHGTEKSLTDWLSMGNHGVLVNTTFKTVVLNPPREDLYQRINVRFNQMIDCGAIEEVERIRTLNLDPQLPVMKALGLRELSKYLDEMTTLSEAIETAQQVSRNYAKRQLIWFRNQHPEAKTISAHYSECKKSEIFSFIRQFLLTNPL